MFLNHINFMDNKTLGRIVTVVHALIDPKKYVDIFFPNLRFIFNFITQKTWRSLLKWRSRICLN